MNLELYRVNYYLQSGGIEKHETCYVIAKQIKEIFGYLMLDKDTVKKLKADLKKHESANKNLDYYAYDGEYQDDILQGGDWIHSDLHIEKIKTTIGEAVKELEYAKPKYIYKMPYYAFINMDIGLGETPLYRIFVGAKNKDKVKGMSNKDRHTLYEIIKLWLSSKKESFLEEAGAGAEIIIKDF